MDLPKVVKSGRLTILITLAIPIVFYLIFCLAGFSIVKWFVFTVLMILSYFVFLGSKVAIWIYRISSIIPFAAFFITGALFTLVSTSVYTPEVMEDFDMPLGLVVGMLLMSVFYMGVATLLFYALWFSKPIKEYWNYKRTQNKPVDITTGS